jgi:hypothetical protein
MINAENLLIQVCLQWYMNKMTWNQLAAEKRVSECEKQMKLAEKLTNLIMIKLKVIVCMLYKSHSLEEKLIRQMRKCARKEIPK